jgi:hypothetical protein
VRGIRFQQMPLQRLQAAVTRAEGIAWKAMQRHLLEAGVTLLLRCKPLLCLYLRSIKKACRTRVVCSGGVIGDRHEKA